MRKKLLALLLVAAPILAACGGATQAGQPVPTGAGGATSPRAAAESFMAAARLQDLQAMSLIWGTENGPARATMERDEMERREVIMLCHLRHDSYEIVEEGALLQGQRRIILDVRLGDMTRRTHLVAVPATNGAWYILSVDLEPLRDICAARR